jgi:phosphotransferase system  glucose/maltose/N-acetylglucosamine-specific IIC component|tara:strand:+ start:315 stop:569 length:255 start_codon:yes stop_codon:yes gene_type:complete
MTKQYIKAYLTMVALTLTTLFGFGFILGSFVFMTGGAVEAHNLERSTWLPWASQAVWFVAGLFAFRFSVKKFIETNKSEQENAK